MLIFRNRSWTTLACLIGCCLMVGCQGQTDSRSPSVSPETLKALRGQFVSQETPELALSIPRVRKKLTTPDAIEGEPAPEPAPASVEVSVKGKICERKALADNPDFPWQPGRAAVHDD